MSDDPSRRYFTGNTRRTTTIETLSPRKTTPQLASRGVTYWCYTVQSKWQEQQEPQTRINHTFPYLCKAVVLSSALLAVISIAAISPTSGVLGPSFELSTSPGSFGEGFAKRATLMRRSYTVSESWVRRCSESSVTLGAGWCVLFDVHPYRFYSLDLNSPKEV